MSPRDASWQRDSVVVPKVFVKDSLRADGPTHGANSVPTPIHEDWSRTFRKKILSILSNVLYLKAALSRVKLF